MNDLYLFYALALVLTLSILVTMYFPVLYAKEKKSVIEQIDAISENDTVASSYPILLVAMLIFPVLVLYHSEDYVLSLYCLIFAILAYADLSARWLPDSLLYTLLVVAMYLVRDKSLAEIVLPVLLFIAPAFFLNLCSFIKVEKMPIARGDFYAFPAIGVTLSCEYAASVMVFAVLITFLFLKKVKQVPFILVLYLTYFGYITFMGFGFL